MTICVFADAAIAPVLSGVTKFREEFEAYLTKAHQLDFSLPAAPGNVSAMIKPPPTVAVAFRKSRRLSSEAGLTLPRPQRAGPRRDGSPCGFWGRCRIGKYCRTSRRRYLHRWVLDSILAVLPRT